MNWQQNIVSDCFKRGSTNSRQTSPMALVQCVKYKIELIHIGIDWKKEV